MAQRKIKRKKTWPSSTLKKIFLFVSSFEWRLEKLIVGRFWFLCLFDLRQDKVQAGIGCLAFFYCGSLTLKSRVDSAFTEVCLVDKT